MYETLQAVRAQLEQSGRLQIEEGRDLLRMICTALLSLGISKVEMDYFGGGDEGAIESSSFHPEETDVPEELRHLAEDWACAVLPWGWEINEGGQGTVTIDVANATARIEHEQKIITTESETYEIG